MADTNSGSAPPEYPTTDPAGWHPEWPPRILPLEECRILLNTGNVPGRLPAWPASRTGVWLGGSV